MHGNRSAGNYKCTTCDVYLCKGASNGRQCFNLHLLKGVPPPGALTSKKGGEAEKWRRVAIADVAGSKRHTNAAGSRRAAKKRAKDKKDAA